MTHVSLRKEFEAVRGKVNHPLTRVGAASDFSVSWAVFYASDRLLHDVYRNVCGVAVPITKGNFPL